METKTLHKLLALSMELSENRLLDPLLKVAMGMAIELVHAERGILALVSDDGRLVYRVKLDHVGNELQVQEEEISHSLLSRVVSTKKSHLISDARLDPEFSKSDSVMSSHLRSMIGIPLIYKNETLGAIYLETRSDGNVLREEDVEPLELFTSHLAVSIKNALLNGIIESKVASRTIELERVNTALGKEIVEKKVFEEQLKEFSITDSLTGLYNRRHFYQLSENELRRAYRYKHDLSIVVIDIDHFRNINDMHGHFVGDQVLKSLAGLCKNLIRENDVIARYGGEEFVFLFPETGIEEAQVAAERVRASIEHSIFVTNAGDISITISAGVSSLDTREEITVDNLIDLADKALFQSKQSGKNLVTAWGSQA